MRMSKRNRKKLEKICNEAEDLICKERPHLAKHLPEYVALRVVSRRRIEMFAKHTDKRLEKPVFGYWGYMRIGRNKKVEIFLSNNLPNRKEYLKTIIHELLHAALFYKKSRNYNKEDVIERMTFRITS